eukprot:TRINITY_DN19728_c0_g1_i1.p1 TRINITY_DN19728_c0_g1~~TRINITY_DN19728_c0_g1_i1.p1  ORF type:complete len:144 (-),score=41.49 TRINITY_DN19728_c0_g1_i1:34-465(-)
MENNYYSTVFSDLPLKDLLGNLLSLLTCSFAPDRPKLAAKIVTLLHFNPSLPKDIQELYFALIKELSVILSVNEKLFVAFHLFTAFKPEIYGEVKAVVDEYLRFALDRLETISEDEFLASELSGAMIYPVSYTHLTLPTSDLV